MGKQTDFSIDEIVSGLLDTILSQKILNKEALTPVVKVYIKQVINIKDRPKYNQIETPNKIAKYIRTIEDRGIEIEFWRNKYRDMFEKDTDFNKIYKELNKIKKENGFE